MIAVADSSPLIALASIGRLDLLPRQYESVVIPPAVYREVVLEGNDRSGAAEVGQATWVRVVPLEEPAQLEQIRELRAAYSGLGSGEIEAVLLASLLGADELLMDDPRGRQLARLRGVRVVGTIAVLVAAHDRGWTGDPVPEVERLADQGFRVSRATLDDLPRRFRP
ncbi:MAG: DUF3368 domain-containing protein [Deltaproteobacteria bacterium]|nr:DUF3368 domain-containing protein [Deltaproteobacteria bacterium]